MTSLYLLSSKGDWVDVIDTLLFGKYTDTYNKIILILNSIQGSGSRSNGTLKTQEIYGANGIITTIINNESHRMCTILAVKQYDPSTKGLRYLVYGTKYNLGCNYGIGLSLESIDIPYVDRWCPLNITAKYIH